MIAKMVMKSGLAPQYVGPLEMSQEYVLRRLLAPLANPNKVVYAPHQQDKIQSSDDQTGFLIGSERL